MPRKIAVIALFFVLFFASISWAGCKSDCRDEFDSEVDSCKLMYDGPDEADDLIMCINNARDEYESCIEECEN